MRLQNMIYSTFLLRLYYVVRTMPYCQFNQNYVLPHLAPLPGRYVSCKQQLRQEDVKVKIDGICSTY